jgi:hypothetical protein
MDSILPTSSLKPTITFEQHLYSIALVIDWHPSTSDRQIERRIRAATHRLAAAALDVAAEADWPIYPDFDALGGRHGYRTKVRAEIDSEAQRSAARVVFERVAALMKVVPLFAVGTRGWLWVRKHDNEGGDR